MLRNVYFSTTSANEEILTLNTVQNLIYERMGWNSLDPVEAQARWNATINGNGFNMRFCIYFPSANSVSINDSSYFNAVEDMVYSTGCYKPDVKSIKVGTIVTNAMISFDIR